MTCTTCGAMNDPSRQRFCGACGAPLAPPPPGYGPGYGYGPPAPWGGSGLLSYGRVEVSVQVLLATVTFGIYWFVWVYRAMRFYREQAGRPPGSLDLYFWGSVISFAVVVFLAVATGGVGLILVIVPVVFTALLIAEISKDRAAIAARYAVTGLTGTAALVTLIVAANLLSVTICGALIGIPLAIWFYYLFYRDHNLLVTSMGA